MKYIWRTLAFPFFACLVAIAVIRDFLTLCFNFIRFGGEGIAYTRKHNGKSIMAVYEKLLADEKQTE